MSTSLNDAKARVREACLGKLGVHAVGVSRTRQLVRVYLLPGSPPPEEELLGRIREAASPFPVIFVESESSQIT